MSRNSQLQYSKFKFSDELKNIIKYGWIMKSNEETQPDFDLLIADGYPEIIFVLRGAYVKQVLNTTAEPSIIDSSCLVGIQSQSVLASRKDYCHLIGLKLYPWGAYHLLGSDLQQAANHNIKLNQLGQNWLIQLNKQLISCNKDSETINLISNVLIGQTKLRSTNKSWLTAQEFIAPILVSNGQISVADLASIQHLSLRHFQRKFKQLFGISPKKFINIIRFKQLYKSSVLQDELPANYLDFGYYDQMHFIKDYHKKLGITPSRTLEQTFLKTNQIAKRSI